MSTRTQLRNKNPFHLALIITALCSLPLVASFASAQSDPIPTMAGIVAEMNHFPSPDQQDILADISEDESHSQTTRTIAQAIHDLEHQAQPEDVDKLEQIVEDSSATEQEQQLAQFVLDFNHKAEPEAQKELKAMAKSETEQDTVAEQ